jgi:hypothetical protein
VQRQCDGCERFWALCVRVTCLVCVQAAPCCAHVRERSHVLCVFTAGELLSVYVCVRAVTCCVCVCKGYTSGVCARGSVVCVCVLLRVEAHNAQGNTALWLRGAGRKGVVELWHWLSLKWIGACAAFVV